MIMASECCSAVCKYHSARGTANSSAQSKFQSILLNSSLVAPTRGDASLNAGHKGHSDCTLVT